MWLMLPFNEMKICNVFCQLNQNVLPTVSYFKSIVIKWSHISYKAVTQILWLRINVKKRKQFSFAKAEVNSWKTNRCSRRGSENKIGGSFFFNSCKEVIRVLHFVNTHSLFYWTCNAKISEHHNLLKHLSKTKLEIFKRDI